MIEAWVNILQNARGGGMISFFGQNSAFYGGDLAKTLPVFHVFGQKLPFINKPFKPIVR